MNNNWVDDIPARPLSDIFFSIIKDSDKFGNLPGEQVNFSTYYDSLLHRIKRTNVEVLEAKNRDDVAAAEMRLKMFKDEMEKIKVGVRRTMIEGLLRTIYACVGYSNGIKVVVPAQAWSGTVDWEDESLLFEDRSYSRLRAIASSELTPEQKNTISQYLTGDHEDSNESGDVGRPNFIKYARAEFRRRKAAGIVLQPFNAEAKWLALWFKKHHPDKKPLAVKTIMNKMSGDYKLYESEMNKCPKK